jgi:PAS domain S-box-containing protein
MLGYENDDMNITIDDFYPLVHPEDVEKVRTALKDHFVSHVPYNIEYRIRKKDNSFAWFYDAGKAIWDEDGKPVRMVGSIINISKRKENEEWIRQQNDLLEKTNAELDRFVYITSHDLKAPLLSIQGLINLAELSSSKAEVDLCLKMMKDRITGLETFIADIINYSRNVRVGLVKEPIDIQKTVDGIINEFLFMKNVDRIHFTVNIDKNINFISDEKRFSVIMKNLISNAIKYHNFDQKSPEIIIQAQKEENSLIISVSDNGEGIEPDMQPRIFEMFFRGSEKSTGSGLGLYIVHEMLEKINGNIRVNSNPGKGTEFIMTLPMVL